MFAVTIQRGHRKEAAAVAVLLRLAAGLSTGVHHVRPKRTDRKAGQLQRRIGEKRGPTMASHAASNTIVTLPAIGLSGRRGDNVGDAAGTLASFRPHLYRRRHPLSLAAALLLCYLRTTGVMAWLISPTGWCCTAPGGGFTIITNALKRVLAVASPVVWHFHYCQALLRCRRDLRRGKALHQAPAPLFLAHCRWLIRSGELTGTLNEVLT